MTGERLQKIIAHAGLASRRAAEDLIRAGRVTVDGRPAHLGQRVDPENAAIDVDGIPLPVRPGLVYWLVNKPTGVVSTAADPHGRRKVTDLVPDGERVYPVGRLDQDSGGLLILTNDGTLTDLLTHPRYEVPKTYAVLVEGRAGNGTLRRLRAGVDLDDGPARPAGVAVVDRTDDRTLLRVVMTEGRKREIRRMMDAVGHPVIELFRTAIGPVEDQTLRSGRYRALTVDEVRALYAAAGGSERAS